MHGWQSESTDGPKRGWVCVFWSGCSGHRSPHPQLLNVVWCGVVWCGVVWCGVVCSSSCSCSCSSSVVVVAVVVVV